MIWAIILQVILIFLNAVFASAEIAVISSSGVLLENDAEKGSRKAKRILKLTSNPSKFLSTIQVAITLSALLGSAYAADSFARPLVNVILSLGVSIPRSVLHSICVLLITLILSFFSIVFGELVPKRLAMKNPEKTAKSISGLLQFVSVAFAPFVFVLTKSTNIVLRLLHINPDEKDDAVTEEEIRMMISSGEEQGTIDSLENEMIQNVFEFDDISVSEIAVHRMDVDFLYTEDGIDVWRDTVKNTGHSYYPVCGENADDIVGILRSKKFFRYDCQTIDEVFEKVIEKPYFIPENTKADIAFTNMKRTRCYFAVVVDEYGGTSGIITMHDLIELLVGKLYETDEKEDNDIIKVGENIWEISGAASLEEVEKALETKLEAEDCDTFGGYILGVLGSVPDDGATLDVDTDRLHIKIKKVEDRRIEKTTVLRKSIKKADTEV